MTVYFTLLLTMTFLGSVASLFLKRASGHDRLVGLLTDINLYAGGSFYFVSAILNIVVLRRLEYSLVLPLTSITYIWTMVISHLALKERITKKKIGGVMLIITGAICVSL